MREGWPVARAGRTIGLLGGSFDPAHAGHAHITREALKRFGLDELWWLVSPGNPLKKNGPAPLERRLEMAHEVMAHPRVKVTALETELGTRFTAETLRALVAHYPGVRFVWLMGADNLAEFHLWENWREIFALVPIAILARPGQRISARMSPAARQFQRYRLRGREAARLATSVPPAWCFVNVPMSDLSSTRIRASGGWSQK
jgi:nicotinate-nucleotide adenylyltransferase